MSTIQNAKQEAKVEIIVRAFRDRPVRLNAVIRGEILEVYRDDSAQAMGWPPLEVFRDDPGVFQTLSSAWESGDQKAIAAAWGHAKLLQLP